MANMAELLDNLIHDYDGTDQADSDNAEWRLTLLGFAKHVNAYIHYYREWDWTYDEDVVAVDAGESTGPLPDNFFQLGHQGGLWDPTQKRQLGKLSISQLKRLKYGTTQSPTSLLESFGIFKRLVELPFPVSSDVELPIVYRITPPVIEDTDDDLLLPDGYALTVLLPAMIFRSQGKKSDTRGEWGAEFKDGLAQMCAAENPGVNGQLMRMPMSNRGMW